LAPAQASLPRAVKHVPPLFTGSTSGPTTPHRCSPAGAATFTNPVPTRSVRVPLSPSSYPDHQRPRTAVRDVQSYRLTPPESAIVAPDGRLANGTHAALTEISRIRYTSPSMPHSLGRDPLWGPGQPRSQRTTGLDS
jgi:hypothetical protein